MWQISRIIGFGLLAGLSVEDLRTRRVSEELLIIAAVLAAGYQLQMKEITGVCLLGGLGIGVLFLLVSYATREALGYGDSILICILGIYVGMTELIEILVVAWVGAAVVSMIILMRRRFTKKATVPFVPFLALGYATVSLGTYLTVYAEV